MSETDKEIEALQAKFAKYNQEHVFKFVKDLNEEQKKQLIANMRDVDLEELAHMNKFVQSADAKVEEEKITPFDKTTEVSSASDADRQKWYNLGLDAIANSEVSLLLLGGGQGTRLGFNLPKGLYDLHLPSRKSLLQLQCERLTRLRHLAAAHANKKVEDISLPWYVMTSLYTHADTVKYFEEQKYFGYPKQDVVFFSQDLLPCLDKAGKIIMQSKTECATAPNGNGGVYPALEKYGILRDMAKRNIKYIHCYCVDNVLVKVCDPTFIGYCVDKKSDCCNKTVQKDRPSEAVGTMCLRNGVPSVIEYSEISKAMSEQKDPNTGRLVYGAGNIANHFFTLEFLQKVAKSKLPYHLAFKKIPSVNEAGETVAPKEPNGYKMEMFVFDVFGIANNCHAFNVDREGEFAALKNAEGGDSPVTARQALSRYHTHLVTKAGGKVLPSENANDCLEISPLVSYEGEGLADLVKGKTFQIPHHIA